MITRMDRRRFLGNLSAAAIGTSAVVPCVAATGKPKRIVDTHTHFYDPTRRGGVPWPEPGSSLYRPVYPKDWLAVAAPHGIRETIVVEASAWLEDNQWILDLAADEKCIIGFVGRIEPDDLDFSKHLQRFAVNPLFRGIRISGEPLRQLQRSDFKRSIQWLTDLGLQLDVNGSPELQQEVIKLAKAFPSLTIVVDHVASAGDASRLSDQWLDTVRSLGDCPNIYCKVSALLEQTEQASKKHGSAPIDFHYYEPILEHCWSCFGEDRLIYGSNWPVCEIGGTYADQLGVVTNFFASKGDNAVEKYFWKNALAAYRWQEAR